MDEEIVSCSYFPGEPVFLQGEKIPEYFKVVSGRFAKVKSEKKVNSASIKKMLAEAELIGIVSHQELFGEIEALMGQPQPFSVFALDESSVFSIPAENQTEMQDVFCQNPSIGVKTCVSFASFLSQFFSYFSSVAHEETDMDKFTRSTARDYLALVNEIETTLKSVKNRSIIEFARSHKAFQIACEITEKNVSGPACTSVNCGVVRVASKEVALQSFKAGSLLCRRGEIGDRLYIVTEGTAEVIIGGNTPNITIDAPGSIIGEIAVFLNIGSASPDQRRTADVVCTTDLTAVVVHLNQVEDFFAKQPELMTKMLLAMVSRTDSTRKICADAEKRLRDLLYKRLGILLEAINNLGHALSAEKDNVLFERPLVFCSQRSRDIYNRFKQALTIINRPFGSIKPE